MRARYYLDLLLILGAVAVANSACVGGDEHEVNDAMMPDGAGTPLTCDELTEPALDLAEVALAGEWVAPGVTYLCFPPNDKPITWVQSPRSRLVDGARAFGACARPRTIGVIEPIRWVEAVGVRKKGAPEVSTCGDGDKTTQ